MTPFVTCLGGIVGTLFTSTVARGQELTLEMEERIWKTLGVALSIAVVAAQGHRWWTMRSTESDSWSGASASNRPGTHPARGMPRSLARSTIR